MILRTRTECVSIVCDDDADDADYDNDDYDEN